MQLKQIQSDFKQSKQAHCLTIQGYKEQKQNPPFFSLQAWKEDKLIKLFTK